jgi:hypothetical protein
MTSYATERKVRIIKETFGDDWKTLHVGKSIDAVYNLIIGDERKNLFCKVDLITKNRLDELTDFYGLKMSELIEHLIENEYQRYKKDNEERVSRIVSQFVGE